MSPRLDVIEAYPNYGGIKTNPNPGFFATFDTSNLLDGQHTVTIKVKSKLNNSDIYSNTKKFNLKKYSGLINIDYPSRNQRTKKELLVTGWALSDYDKEEIKMYIDNDETKEITNVTRKTRNDIFESVSGYGGKEKNSTPGFQGTYDVTTLSDGQHTINVKMISRVGEQTEIISESSQTFYVKKYDGNLCIDTPNGSNFSSDITVSGWEMSELDNSDVRFYIDGNQVQSQIARYYRKDVIENETNYGGIEVNATPGFSGVIPISSYNEGFHILEVRVYSRLNEYITGYSKKIFISKSLSYGIDVSKWNTVTSWPTVRAYGIDYAMIRLGYRGYKSVSLAEDEKFISHMDGALNSGIKTGVYFFSQAINYNEGVEEANYVLNKLYTTGYYNRLSMPIAIDSEYSSDSHTGRADYISKQDRTNAIRGFIDTIRAAGYTPMIYASRSWFYNQLDMSQLSNADIWLAEYNSNPLYNGPYQIWQYTSNGYINGISGKVDLSYVYKRY